MYSTPTHFYHFRPPAEHCFPLPSGSSCACLPRSAIEPDYADFTASVLVNHLYCRALHEGGTDCFHMPECEGVTSLSSFETGLRAEAFATQATLGVDNRPLCAQVWGVRRSVDNEDVMRWFREDPGFDEHFAFSLPRVVLTSSDGGDDTASTASTAGFSR